MTQMFEPSAILAVEGLSKRFGGLDVLSSVDVAVHDQEIVGLIGPNGAGKSTVINCVSGVLCPDRGNVRLREHNVTGLPAHRLCRLGLARTFQHSRLIAERTCRENVALGAHRQGTIRLGLGALRPVASRREEHRLRAIAEAALDDVGCGDLADVAAGALTAGQQRLVAVARALATRPAVLLLDEPAAGLNESEITGLANCLRQVRSSGVSLLVVEHHMSLVLTVCDRVAVLANGALLAVGTPDEIRRDPAVVAAYLGQPR